MIYYHFPIEIVRSKEPKTFSLTLSLETKFGIYETNKLIDSTKPITSIIYKLRILGFGVSYYKEKN
jgi:hypothetical protein